MAKELAASRNQKEPVPAAREPPVPSEPGEAARAVPAGRGNKSAFYSQSMGNHDGFLSREVIQIN